MVRPSTREEAEALSRIAARADLPYFRVDAQRNVTEMSPALARLTGFDAEEIVGRSCLRVHRCTECLKGCGVFDQGVVTDKELELYRADGSTVRVRKSGRVFFDDEGTIAGAVEIVEAVDDAPEGREALESRDAAEPTEATRIREALEQARYRRVEAARILGVSRTTLWRKMNEYGL